jgi:hypothetical protein
MMASRKQTQEPTPRQKAAQSRILGTDPEASFELIQGWLKASYTPAWEKGRNVGGTFRPNPNPQRIIFALDEAGRLFGWGYTKGSELPKVAKSIPFPITTPETMKEPLNERAQLRAPEKPEEPETTKAEPKAPTKRTSSARKTKTSPRKTTSSKKTTRRSGVQVVAKTSPRKTTSSRRTTR